MTSDRSFTRVRKRGVSDQELLSPAVRSEQRLIHVYAGSVQLAAKRSTR